jgi:high-affinity iron transporter
MNTSIRRSRRLPQFIASLLLSLCVIAALLSVTGSASAQGLAPSDAATQIRKALFAAQTAAMTGDSSAATSLQTALKLYQDTFAAPVSNASPDAAGVIDRGFQAAAAALTANDSIMFASERARIWGALLGGAADVTLNAIMAGDIATARAWFAVREYRPASRFNRPGADGTLALNALQAGTMNAADALAAVRADLYDTYQARLNGALNDADTAIAKGYTTKLAEAAGAAAGYFGIIDRVYGDQRGASQRADTVALFDQLVRSAAGGNVAAFTATRAKVADALTGFRAAPLSQAELDRRAGQLMRYIGLVDVEYARGVRDGKVVKDLEIQEAHTFRESALAAFVDLAPSLTQLDATRTATVDGLIRGLKGQIDRVVDPAEIEKTVNTISDELTTLIPPAWLKNSANSDFDVIYAVLDQIEPAVQQGQYQMAESARIEAYAILDSAVEQKLRAFTPDLALRIEGGFWSGEADKPGLAVLIASKAPAAEVRSALGRLRDSMKEGQTVMASFKSAPGAVVGNAAVIVFREGLEAVLILASLIASLRTAETRRYRRPIAIGAFVAFGASAVTWLIANTILTALSKYGEKLEAIVGIIAIAVLLVITNWFFHKTYWTGWMANFHQQKNKLIGGGMAFGTFVALIALGFSSIYREGFETVLFLQSLVLEAGVAVVVQGVLIGLFFTGVVGVITFALQAKLPYKRMLIITGIFIGFVLVSMVGKTVFALQAVGWLPITPIAGVWFPYWMGQWVGLYATWQGILLQIGSAVFVIGSYFLAEHQNKVKRAALRTSRTGAAGAAREDSAGAIPGPASNQQTKLA